MINVFNVSSVDLEFSDTHVTGSLLYTFSMSFYTKNSSQCQEYSGSNLDFFYVSHSWELAVCNLKLKAPNRP